MAKVTIRIIIPFSNMYPGDEAEVEMGPVVQGWVNLGFAEVISRGPSEVGPSGAVKDDPGSGKARAGSRRKTDAESGEDPVSG